MKELSLCFCALLSILFFNSSAQAAEPAAGTGSYKVNKDQLDRVKFFQAPRILHIVDERPIVKNHLVPEQTPDSYEINAAFPPASPGKHYVIGSPAQGDGSALPFRTSMPGLGAGALAPASDMYHSNIPAKLPVNTNLAPGRSTGIHGPTGAQASPVANAGRSVSGRLHPPNKGSYAPQLVSKYVDYSSAGAAASSSTIKTKVTGNIKPGTLIGRLNQN